jgi:hypothetical protein
MEVCAVRDPEPFTTSDGTEVRCHLHTSVPTLAGTSVMELATRPQ